MTDSDNNALIGRIKKLLSFYFAYYNICTWRVHGFRMMDRQLRKSLRSLG